MHCIVKRMMLALTLVLTLCPLLVPTTFAAGKIPQIMLVGPRSRYLALGDSLAFGFQPNLQLFNGYADGFASDLRQHGVRSFANMSCSGETTETFIGGGCPLSFVYRTAYNGSQLDAALHYLARYRGQVSPVTLDLGENDLLNDMDERTCGVNMSQFNTDLARLDANLTQIILPRLHAALMINGQLSGDLLMMNYYDPYQNICPRTVPLVQIVNQHLKRDLEGYGTIVDVFSAFGGASTPNAHICDYTWICTVFDDVHASTLGYNTMVGAFEKAAGY